MPLLAACGGSNSDSSPSIVPVTATTLPSVAAGEGLVVLDDQVQRFTVTDCIAGVRPVDKDVTAAATPQFRLRGTGKAGTLAFQVSVTRYSSSTGVGGVNLTETASVSAGSGEDERDVEAKRTRLAGQTKWLDLNDPTQTGPLIERRGTLVEVDATFGPQGSQKGEAGLGPGRIRARCP